MHYKVNKVKQVNYIFYSIYFKNFKLNYFEIMISSIELFRIFIKIKRLIFNFKVKRPSTGRPRSNMSVVDHNLVNKKFDFNQKSFKTVKKTDPVARINALK